MQETVELVVVEQGAHWPTWASQSNDEAADRVVVVSDAGTKPMDLALRALERVARIESSQRRLGSAIVIIGTASAPDSMEVRIMLSRTLLAHMAGERRGELVFAMSGAREPSDRLELMALAGTLTEHLSGTRLSVSVRFGDERVAHDPPRDICIRRVKAEASAVA